jgi:hypothetical protein
MKNFPRLVFLGIFLATAALVASAQLVQWTFDDPGSATFLTNSGSLGAEMDLRTFISSNPDPLIIPATATRANLQSTNTPGGVGKSLDLTSSTAMKAAQGAFGNIASTTNNVSGLTAMTITGWFNASAAPSSGVQLIRANTAANNGWVLSFKSDRQMRLNIGNGTTATNFNSSPTAFAVSPVGVWQFFAISWNSTVGHTWYAGSPTAAAAAAGTGTALATMNANPYQLSLGRSGSGSGTAFYGYLDDIRIYNTALTAEQVEALRLSNLAALPAPAAHRRPAPAPPRASPPMAPKTSPPRPATAWPTSSNTPST